MHAYKNYLLGLHTLDLKNVPYRCTKLSPRLSHSFLHFYSSSDLFCIQLKYKIQAKTLQKWENTKNSFKLFDRDYPHEAKF